MKSPQDRAEEIVKFIDEAGDKYLYRHDSCIDFIKAQIKDAVNEAIDDIAIGLREHEVSQATRNQALDEAAKVAETFVEQPTDITIMQEYRNLCMKGIAERIRALKDGKEKKI